MSNPGPLMGAIAGTASGPFDLGAGISIYMLSFVILVWVGNWLIVRNGISQGIERSSKFFTPVLMVMMIIFMINSVTLEGAAEGLNTLFTLNFQKY